VLLYNVRTLAQGTEAQELVRVGAFVDGAWRVERNLTYAGGAATPPVAPTEHVLRVRVLGEWWDEVGTPFPGRARSDGNDLVMVAIALAVRDFNARNGTYVAAFGSAETRACGITLLPEYRHTGWSAPRALSEAVGEGVDAVLGPVYSSQAEASGHGLGLTGTPQVTVWTSGASLSNVDELPSLVRNYPSTLQYASTFVQWLHFNGWTQAGMLVDASDFGTAYSEAMVSAATALGINVVIASFADQGEQEQQLDSLRAAVGQLAARDMRIVLAPVSSASLPGIAQFGREFGLFSDAHHWVFYNSFPISTIEKMEPAELRAAFDGAAYIQALGGKIGHGPFEAFRSHWTSGAFSPEDVNALLPSIGHIEDSYFGDNFNDITAFAYDAVATLGLGACTRPMDVLGHPEFGRAWWSSLAPFEGVSGSPEVIFDDNGDRHISGLAFALRRITVAPAAGAGAPSPPAHPIAALLTSGSWETIPGQAFVFTDGTTTPPADRAPPTVAGSRGKGDSSPSGSGGGAGEALATSPGLSSDVVMALLYAAVALVGFAIAVAVVLRVRRARLRWFEALAAEHEVQQREEERIVEAARFMAHLRAPMCLVRLDDFTAHGKLLLHEVVRDRGQLHVLDTYEEVLAFTADTEVIFVSHQWLGSSEPDPHDVHYTAMKGACHRIANDLGKNPQEVYVWVDYLSIPQRCEGLKLLSIQSLALYAATASTFLVVAPESVHADTGAVCNLDTYKARGWCRLENWAAILRINELARVYVVSSGDGAELHNLESDPEYESLWWSTAVRVFDGQFTVEEDKALLVNTILGLWIFSLKRQSHASQRVLEVIGNEREGVFPKRWCGKLVDTADGMLALRPGKPNEREQRADNESARAGILRTRVATSHPLPGVQRTRMVTSAAASSGGQRSQVAPKLVRRSTTTTLRVRRLVAYRPLMSALHLADGWEARATTMRGQGHDPPRQRRPRSHLRATWSQLSRRRKMSRTSSASSSKPASSRP